MVIPSNLCKRRLHNFLFGKTQCELRHVFQVSHRVAGGVWKRHFNVCGKIFNKFVAPCLVLVDDLADGVVISSVLFGVYHLNIVQAVYATFMGIAAGILYEKKKNLLFPILVHFVNNLITMLQSFAPSEVNELISIFILIMIAPAGYVVCRSLRQGKRADSM